MASPRRGLGPRRYFDGRFTTDRVAWTFLPPGTFVLYSNPSETPDTQPGNDVTMHVPSKGRLLAIRLADMTEEELLVLKKFFDLAFELALPVAKDRDRVAKEMSDAGDDTFVRLYRAVPELFVRQRTERQHDQSVSSGLAGVPQGRGHSDLPVGSGKPSPPMAPEVPLHSGTQDDGPKTN